MVEVRIEPADAARFADVQATLTGGGDGAGCQCQWWTLTNAEFGRTKRDERTELLRRELASPLAPGLVAYVDDTAAGWVRVGPRVPQARIGRSRGIRRETREPLDAPDVWAVTCFSVRREHRGVGLTGALLNAAIAFATEHGARVVEGYAYDTALGGVNVNDLYHGAVSTFEAAGFERIAPLGTRTVLMERTLGA
jgi:GNAT superfamily N-acetyltransferase